MARHPFASLDTPWINDVRTALEAEWFSAVLDRNDAALRVGRHGELLPQLSAMSADHPLDERLAGQLMLAQFRCGRQADALETFRAMRDASSRSSARTRARRCARCISRFSTAIPSIRPWHPCRVLGSHPAARGVPRRITSFVGRGDDIAYVTDVLLPAPR